MQDGGYKPAARISRDEWGLRLAEVTALRGTCLRRQVGCVLMDAAGGVISTGYNGVASGLPHCGSPGCSCNGQDRVSGFGLDACEAIHAEQNALIKCGRPREIKTCYVTVSPCLTCVKMLLNTSCSRIVARREYAHGMEAGRLWLCAGRTWKIDGLDSGEEAR